MVVALHPLLTPESGRTALRVYRPEAPASTEYPSKTWPLDGRPSPLPRREGRPLLRSRLELWLLLGRRRGRGGARLHAGQVEALDGQAGQVPAEHLEPEPDGGQVP